MVRISSKYGIQLVFQFLYEGNRRVDLHAQRVPHLIVQLNVKLRVMQDAEVQS